MEKVSEGEEKRTRNIIDEDAVEPFLVASYDRETAKLLRFLFIPPTLFQVAPETPHLLVLPEVKGGESEEYTLVEKLIRSKTKHGLQKVFLQFSNLIIQSLIMQTIKDVKLLIAAQVEEGQQIDETKISAIVASSITSKVKEYEKRFSDVISKITIPFIQSVGEGLAILLMDFILKRWKNVNAIEPSYPEMLNIMKRLDIIRPLLQVIVCPNCSLTSLVLSKAVVDVDYCPKCGKRPLVGTIYILKENLARLKQYREDIVHFIAAYLKYSSLYFLSPLIKIKHQVKEEAEVDVYIEDLNYGIECKIYDSIWMPSKNQLENWLRDLKSKIDKYVNAEVKRMLIVTNLREEYVRFIKTELNKYMDEKGYRNRIRLEDVLGVDHEKLIEKLNDIAKEIVKYMEESTTKWLEAQVKTELTRAGSN